LPLDPALLLVGLPTILLVAIGKGAFGGGLAMLGVPLLSLAVDPITATIVVAPLVVFMDLFALAAFRVSTWSKPDLAWLAPGLVAGIALGNAVLFLVDARIVTLLIATITLAFVADYFVRARRRPAGGRPVSPPLALLAGTASGFTTFIAHAGGPPVAMYLLGRGLTKTVFAGTTVALFTVANLVKLPTYAALGWNRPGVVAGVLALAPAVPVGVWIGKRLHDALPQARLFFWCYLLLGAAALKLVADALRGFLV
jgi:uncharacterized protein